jgi:hypothetical protein
MKWNIFSLLYLQTLKKKKKKIELAAVSDASELASGFHDALMQDESSYAELDADYAESEILGDSDCCEKEYSEHENPSMTSVGCISAQLKVEVLYNESPDGSLHCKPFIQPCADLPSDSTNAEVLRSGMDIEPVNEHIDAVILSGDALGLKSVQMNEKAADPRQVELPPDLQNVQVPVGYAGGSLPENLSKQISGDVLPDQLIFFFLTFSWSKLSLLVSMLFMMPHPLSYSSILVPSKEFSCGVVAKKFKCRTEQRDILFAYNRDSSSFRFLGKFMFLVV